MSVGCFAAMMRRVDRNPNPNPNPADPNQPPQPPSILVQVPGGPGNDDGDDELPGLINEDGDEVEMNEDEDDEEDEEEEEEDEEDDDEEEEDGEYDVDPMRALLAQEVAWGQMMAREVLGRNQATNTTSRVFPLQNVFYSILNECLIN